MTSKLMTRGRVRDAGVWQVLQPLLRKLRAAANHPHYAARGNEQPLLAQLVADDPPVGGMSAYIADMSRE